MCHIWLWWDHFRLTHSYLEFSLVLGRLFLLVGVTFLYNLRLLVPWENVLKLTVFCRFCLYFASGFNNLVLHLVIINFLDRFPSPILNIAFMSCKNVA
ncbi:hypothetical protein HID58_080047 [Brassica napus]|uniref:Uncharacterized protein n=1 Tax=Brassica napus TaxID=3708 RepID=A0ABQ7Y3U2_BRANA|nr:hypothetical protein HID58_080047 [Brassica napus]